MEWWGWVDDVELEWVKNVGFSDGEIVEVVVVILLNLFINYFNYVVDLVVDFFWMVLFLVEVIVVMYD